MKKLNDQMQNNVRGNFQNEIKTNNKDNVEDDAKLLIEKIEKLVVQYQKLKQVQDDLQEKVNQLEVNIGKIQKSDLKIVIFY